MPGIIAVMITYIGEEWAGRGVGSMMSAYVSGTVLGGFLGRFLSAQVVTHFRWQDSFLLLGALNLIGAMMVWRWLPPSTTFKRAPGILHTVRHTGEHFLNWPLVTNFVTGFTVLFSLVGAFTSINFYLAAPPLGLGPGALGNVFFVYLLGLIVTPISGRFLDRRGFLRTATVAVAMGIAGLALTLVHSLWAIIPGLAVFSSGIFILQSARHCSDWTSRRKSALVGNRTLRHLLLHRWKLWRGTARLDVLNFGMAIVRGGAHHFTDRNTIAGARKQPRDASGVRIAFTKLPDTGGRGLPSAPTQNKVLIRRMKKSSVGHARTIRRIVRRRTGRSLGALRPDTIHFYCDKFRGTY